MRILVEYEFDLSLQSGNISSVSGNTVKTKLFYTI